MYTYIFIERERGREGRRDGQCRVLARRSRNDNKILLTIYRLRIVCMVMNNRKWPPDGFETRNRHLIFRPTICRRWRKTLIIERNRFQLATAAVTSSILRKLTCRCTVLLYLVRIIMTSIYEEIIASESRLSLAISTQRDLGFPKRPLHYSVQSIYSRLDF